MKTLSYILSFVIFVNLYVPTSNAGLFDDLKDKYKKEQKKAKNKFKKKKQSSAKKAVKPKKTKNQKYVPSKVSIKKGVTHVIKSPSKNYKTLTYETFRGLPRLGIQNFEGMKKQDPKNKQIISRLNNHNLSLYLLLHYDFMQKNKDCFSGVNGYLVTKSNCVGFPIPHGSQTAFWHQYIKMMAYSLKDANYEKTFCLDDNKGCQATSIDRIQKMNTKKGRHENLNEFEKRDFIADLFKKQQNPFDKHWKKTNIPKEAYLVSKVRLGEYDFDNQSFSVRLSSQPFSNDFSQYYQNSRKRGLKNRLFLFHGQYVATKDFEKQRYSGSTDYLYNVSFPMNSKKARKLIEGNNKYREYYAVTKIKLLEPSFNSSQDVIRYLTGASYSYHLAKNKVELFSDEALTKKIAEEKINTEVKKNKEVKKINKYVLNKGVRLFDSRLYNALYIKSVELTKKSLIYLTSNIVRTENEFWREYNLRVKQLKTAQEIILSYRTSAEAKAAKINEAKDRLKLNSFNWQQLSQLNSEQKQAYFNSILNYGDVKNINGSQINWPKELKAIPWGMNYLTVFKKGVLPGTSTAPFDENNQNMINTVKNFVKALGNSQDFSTTVLISNVKKVSYDQGSKSLKIPRMRGAVELKNVSYVTANNKSGVSQKAKNKVIYNLMISDGYIGNYFSNPNAVNCQKNQISYSKNCINMINVDYISNGVVSNVLALDRKLNFKDSVPMSLKKATKLLNYRHPTGRYSPGWRYVIELENLSMDVSSFTHPKDKRELESRTTFAKLKRILLIAPNDEIVWSKKGSEFESAQSATKKTKDISKAKNYHFPKNLNFQDSFGVLNAPILDFFLAKYQPNKLNKKMIEGMISSRWSYEQIYKDKPIGGRFFKKNASTPSYSDVKDMGSSFKKWLLIIAKKLPDEFILISRLAYANNTVKPAMSCLKYQQPKNAPLRNNYSAEENAKTKTKQCKNTHRKALRKYERCEEFNQRIFKAKQQLTKAKENQCGLNQKDNLSVVDSDEDVSSNNGLCDFSKGINAVTMQQEMMKCLTKVCGDVTQTTNMQNYQQCSQSVVESSKKQFMSMMGLPSNNRKKTSENKNQVKNSCKGPERELKLVNSDFRRLKCSHYTNLPEEPDCRVALGVKIPDFMEIERLTFNLKNSCAANNTFDRSHKTATILLPKSSNYSKMNSVVELTFKNFNFPYNPPMEVKNNRFGVNIDAKLRVKIIGINSNEIEKDKLILNASVENIVYVETKLFGG